MPLIAAVFPIVAARSAAYPFYFFAAMMALQFVLVLFVFPETKGVSLERIQAKLGIEGLPPRADTSMPQLIGKEPL